MSRLIGFEVEHPGRSESALYKLLAKLAPMNQLPAVYAPERLGRPGESFNSRQDP